MLLLVVVGREEEESRLIQNVPIHISITPGASTGVGSCTPALHPHMYVQGVTGIFP